MSLYPNGLLLAVMGIIIVKVEFMCFQQVPYHLFQKQMYSVAEPFM